MSHQYLSQVDDPAYETTDSSMVMRVSFALPRTSTGQGDGMDSGRHVHTDRVY